MQPAYGPSDFSSAVLGDGRSLSSGGNITTHALLAMFGPTWAPYTIQRPTHGRLYPPQVDGPISEMHPTPFCPMGSSCWVKLATLANTQARPVTLTWTNLNDNGPDSQEAGFTLLPDGTVLIVDVYAAPQAERYFPLTDT